MDNSESGKDTSSTKVQDNAEEISWVSYGIISTVSMVIYQFFLIQFCNEPSTISVKASISLLIGVLAIVFVSISEILSYIKLK